MLKIKAGVAVYPGIDKIWSSFPLFLLIPKDLLNVSLFSCLRLQFMIEESLRE